MKFIKENSKLLGICSIWGGILVFFYYPLVEVVEFSFEIPHSTSDGIVFFSLILIGFCIHATDKVLDSLKIILKVIWRTIGLLFNIGFWIFIVWLFINYPLPIIAVSFFFIAYLLFNFLSKTK